MRFHGERFKRARKYRGISQLDLARACKVAQNTISDLERNGAEDIRSTFLADLTKTLGVSAEYLRGVGPDTPPDAPVLLGTPVEKNSDWSVNLESAMEEAFSRDRHKFRDVDAVRATLARASFRPSALPLVRAARLWLDAAAILRDADVPVTAENFALALVVAALRAEP